MNVTRKLILADGTQTDLIGRVTIARAALLIGADSMDSVMLADRTHVMLVDDTGVLRDLPFNAEATRLYHERCGRVTPNSIHGDVIIAPDSDFGGVM